jgi:hypothetical protein
VPRGIETYLADVGLDGNDYLIEPMSSMQVEGLVTTTSLCTIDKPRLLRDFRQHGVLKRQNLRLEEAGDYGWWMRPGSPGLSCHPAAR